MSTTLSLANSSATKTVLPQRMGIFFRRKGEDGEGRGFSWSPGNLSGWDNEAAMVHCLSTGHSRTLSLDLWELSFTKRKGDRIEIGHGIADAGQ